MPRPIFRQSEETAKIIAFLKALPVGKMTTREELQAAVGPHSDTAYYSARRIVLKDGVTIETARGVGFFRASGSETVQSLASDLQAIRRRSKKVMTKCSNALRDNLTPDDQFRAMRVQAAAGIIHSNASMPVSNVRRPVDDAVHQNLLTRGAVL